MLMSIAPQSYIIIQKIYTIAILETHEHAVSAIECEKDCDDHCLRTIKCLVYTYSAFFLRACARTLQSSYYVHIYTLLVDRVPFFLCPHQFVRFYICCFVNKSNVCARAHKKDL